MKRPKRGVKRRFPGTKGKTRGQHVFAAPEFMASASSAPLPTGRRHEAFLRLRLYQRRVVPNGRLAHPDWPLRLDHASASLPE